MILHFDCSIRRQQLKKLLKKGVDDDLFDIQKYSLGYEEAEEDGEEEEAGDDDGIGRLLQGE
jgi:hypothetical protein